VTVPDETGPDETGPDETGPDETVPERAVPILEVGGTHVTAARVHPGQWRVDRVVRHPLDGHASAADLIAAIAEAGARVQAPDGADWGVAMPGPFDYEHGIARFTGVAKFDSLSGVDLRAALTSALPRRPRSITFVNDASAFLLGEWLAGAVRGVDRCAALTLGTGIGSAFLDRGRVIDHGPNVPPQAEVHLIVHDGLPLEDWVSRRAIRRRYAEEAGSAARIPEPDVHEIAELARCGDAVAAATLDAAFTLLGRVVGPWLARFQAQALVVGGSISRSWDLIESPLRTGLSDSVDLELRLAEDPEHAPLIGAAYPAVTRAATTPAG
jgi:glucokinase